jgi:hypothetical protein
VIQHLNIATTLEVGLRAFRQLSAKAQQSRAMFESIKGFSKNVKEILDIRSLRCLAIASPKVCNCTKAINGLVRRIHNTIGRPKQENRAGSCPTLYINRGINTARNSKATVVPVGLSLELLSLLCLFLFLFGRVVAVVSLA